MCRRRRSRRSRRRRRTGGEGEGVMENISMSCRGNRREIQIPV
jgi:hypothetical protein